MTDDVTHDVPPDVIDAVLGITPGSPLDRLRRQRETLRTQTQASFRAALLPHDPGRLQTPLRAALAARMAALWDRNDLAAFYRTLATDCGADGAMLQLSDPATAADAPLLAAILRHVDLVTRHPKDATAGDIRALQAACLEDHEIVTLTGLIAFVNFQILVVAGLRLMEKT